MWSHGRGFPSVVEMPCRGIWGRYAVAERAAQSGRQVVLTPPAGTARRRRPHILGRVNWWFTKVRFVRAAAWAPAKVQPPAGPGGSRIDESFASVSDPVSLRLAKLPAGPCRSETRCVIADAALVRRT